MVDAVIYTTAAANEDYSITQLGQYTRILLGAVREEEHKAAKVSAGVLGEAGIEYEIPSDVRQAVWEKYIFNCAIVMSLRHIIWEMWRRYGHTRTGERNFICC
ncbi:MAG: ketopantoate reductase family protein [Sellimonas intestinalis]